MVVGFVFSCGLKFGGNNANILGSHRKLSSNRTTANNHQRDGCGRLEIRAGMDKSDQNSNSYNNAMSHASRYGQRYLNFTGFPFPLRPFVKRKTIRKELVPGKIWGFEQEHGLGFTFVAVNIRMTVIKLDSNELFLHAPIAPTEECLQLLAELNAPVKYIILPTFAYEHKVYVGPFSRRFPDAKVYTVKTWSWPINLPNQFFGIFPAGELVNNDKETPWASELDQKVLGPASLGIAPYTEAVFFHKSTKSLIVTDAVVRVPKEPLQILEPDVIQQGAEDKFYSKFKTGELPVPTSRESWPEPTRALGWARIALLSLYFGPNNLLNPMESFDAVSGKLIVAPVVRKLVFSRISNPVKEFALEVARDFQFDKIIPAHFDAPIDATPREWLAAFEFLSPDKIESDPLPENDFETLDKLERLLLKFGLSQSDKTAS